MKGTKLLALVACVACVIGHALAQTPPPTQSSVDAELQTAATSTATPEQITTALDDLFSISGIDSTFADSNGITGTLVQAQQAYAAGSASPLDEAHVVTAINNLSTAWSLPSYTQTTANEVRQLHVALIQSFPGFLASDLPAQTAAGSTTIVHTSMSPLEGVLLFCMLAHQKMTNPQWQMTVDEYNAADNARHNGQLQLPPTDRTADIAAAIQQALATMTSNTMASEANSALGDLGVTGGGL